VTSNSVHTSSLGRRKKEKKERIMTRINQTNTMSPASFDSSKNRGTQILVNVGKS
jgi:hypothetical protein